MENKEAMQTSNTEKATTGNKFQENFFEKVCYTVGDVAKIRNNATKHRMEIHTVLLCFNRY